MSSISSDHDLRGFIDIHKNKKISIKDFSNSNIFEKLSIRFKLATFPAAEYCIVEIYPNGITPKHQGFVSAEMSKFPFQDESVKWFGNFDFQIFFSVVDVNGDERCHQSFAQKNIDLPFGIPELFTRSFLISLADEFLPEDTLTIKCELVGIYYTASMDIIKKLNSSDSSEECIVTNEECSGPSSDKPNKQPQSRFSLELLKIVSCVHSLHGCFFTLMEDVSYMQKGKDIFPIFDGRDEVRQTFFSSLEIFQKYLDLKDKLRNILNNSESNILCKVLNILFKVTYNLYKHIEEKRRQSFSKDEIFSSSSSEEDDHCEEKESSTKESQSNETEEECNKLMQKLELYENESCGEDDSFPEYETSIRVSKANNQITIMDMDGLWKLIQNPEANLTVLNEKRLFETMIKYVSFCLDSYEKWKGKLLKELDCETNDKESERITQIKEDEYYKGLLNDEDKKSTIGTDHPANYEKALRICENIRELLQLFLEMHFFCHQICKDIRQDKIDNIFHLRKQQQSSESHYESGSMENQSKWILYVETFDDVLFTIPFEVGKVTLGSKLISHSVFFERMLENPMREKKEKRVKLNNTDCDTFINFLYFLQTEEIKAETLAELCNLYEFADQYDVPEIMSLCVELMPSFLSLSNSDEIEELGHLHADKHVIELVQSFTKEGPRHVSGLHERREISLDEKSSALKAELKDGESSFEFYQ